MKKTFAEVFQKINLAIDLKNEAFLREAINEAQLFERGSIAGKAPWRRKPRWAVQAHGGSTPLARAIKQRWLAGVEILAPLSSMKVFSWQALPAMQCAEMGWREGLTVVAQGGFLDMPGENGKTAIMMAAYRGRHECVAELIARGASVNQQRDSDVNRWKSPLHAAAVGGCAKSARLLIEAGADVWIKKWLSGKSEGVSALDLALHVDDPSWAVAHVLLSSEAGEGPAPALNALGQTPLLAIMSKPRLICEALEYNEDGARGEDLLWKMIDSDGMSGRDSSGMGVINYANRYDVSSESMDFKRRLLERAGIRKPLELSESNKRSNEFGAFLAEGFDLKDLSNEIFRRECFNNAASSSEETKSLDPMQVAQEVARSKKTREYAENMAENIRLKQEAFGKGPAAAEHPAAPTDPESQAEMDAAVAQCLEAMGSMASAMARLASCVNAREAADPESKRGEASEELRDVSLGIMSRAHTMREQIKRLASKASAPRKSR